MADDELRPLKLPSDTPTYMAQAWVDCLRWAIGCAKIRAAFEEETGLKYSAPRSPIDAMIDEATGNGDVYVQWFVGWFNENIWGKM